MKTGYRIAENRATGTRHLVKGRLNFSDLRGYTYCGQEVSEDNYIFGGFDADFTNDAEARSYWQKELCHRCMQAILRDPAPESAPSTP